jgi:hypothetical protein
LQIKATETEFRDNTTSRFIRVFLLNWNDEIPKFEEDLYVFEVPETVTKDYSIGAVKANDRDIDDKIE